MGPDLLFDPSVDPDDVDDDDLLTAWESDFLVSIASQDYELTAAQEQKADEIEALVAERREQLMRARRGAAA